MVEFPVNRRSTPFTDLLQRLRYRSEVEEYCENPLVVTAIKYLYERQRGIELIEPLDQPDKIMTCKELCEKCNEDMTTLENTLLGKRVYPFFFTKYKAKLNDEEVDAIRLENIGIGWAEEWGYMTEIKRKLFPGSKEKNYSQPHPHSLDNYEGSCRNVVSTLTMNFR